MNYMWTNVLVPRRYTLVYLGLNIMMSSLTFKWFSKIIIILYNNYIYAHNFSCVTDKASWQNMNN